MREFLNRHLTVVTGCLAALIVVSLAFNGVLLARSFRTDDRVEEVAGGAAVLATQAGTFLEQLDSLAPVLDRALDTANTELEALRTSTIAFDVEVDQIIPVVTSFPFRRSLTIPIDTSIPINETFETRVTVEGPLGVDVGLDVTIPVDIDVPFNLAVPVEIDETIDIDAEFPLRLAVPLEVDIASTGFADLAARLQEGISAVREAVASF